MTLYIPRLQQGSYRDICPECGVAGTLSVTVRQTKALWFCHRASCGYKGGQGGTNFEPKTPKPNYLTYAEGRDIPWLPEYTKYPVKDNEGTVRGYVLHAIDKNITSPKRKLYKDEDWCGLAFPRRVVYKHVLLVEDILSARAMSTYFPTAALLGIHLNHAKVDYLYNEGITKATVALDNDATLQAIRIKRLHPIVNNVILLERDLKNETDEKLQEIAEKL